MTGPWTAAVIGLPNAAALAAADLALVDLDAAGSSTAVDALVVGAPTVHDLARLQAGHTRLPDVGAVVVVSPATEAEVRRALRFTPGIPTDLEISHDDAELADVVRAVARRTVQRRRHRAIIATVAALPHDPRPSLRPSSASLGAVLDHAPIGVVVAAPSGEVMSWNPRAADILGLDAGDAGSPVAALFAQPDVVIEILSATATAGGFGPATAVATARRPAGVVELNATATELDDGRQAMLLLLVDVTGRRAAEAARDELQRRLQVVRRSQEFLLRASDVLAGATDYADTLTQLAAIAVPTLGDLCIIDVLERGRFRRLAARHANPAQQPLVDELQRRYPPLTGGSHPAAMAVRAGGTVWTAEIPEELKRSAALDDRHYEIVTELDFTGYIAVPLKVGDDVLGILTLVACGSSRRFGPEDVVLVEELAGRVALVVAKARRYDREHQIALALQRSMLTAVPDLTPWQVAARYVPAAGDVQVGGDWYDAFALPGAGPVVVIGDVVGHDLEATAAMGQLRSALRALAWSGGGRPAHVLEELDTLNEGLRITDFATILVAALHLTPAGADLRWSSAGHLPPLVLAGGAATFLAQQTDPVLGVAEPRPRREHVAHLDPGTTLLLYTDGLVERRRQSVAEGMELLAAAAADLATAPLDTLCDALVARLAVDAQDDVALLAVRVPPTGLGQLSAGPASSSTGPPPSPRMRRR